MHPCTHTCTHTHTHTHTHHHHSHAHAYIHVITNMYLSNVYLDVLINNDTVLDNKYCFGQYASNNTLALDLNEEP